MYTRHGGKIMKKKELIKALEKEKKKNRKKKKVVEDWLCPGCGSDHTAGSCMHYQKKKNQYWAIKRYYGT